jgi:predicted nucleic acid-binding protein
LVDVNIFEDVFRRRKGFLESERILELVRSGTCEGYISSATVLIIYFLRKRGRTDVEAREIARKIIKKFQIMPLNSEIIENSFNSNMPEFEDNIQFYSAMSANVEYLVTRNKKHYKANELEIVNPDELLTILERNQ